MITNNRMTRSGRLSLFFLVITACLPSPTTLAEPGNEHRAIHALLDGLHQDAHTGNFERYFARYTEDAVFLGTDKTERWPIEEFKDYAKPAFEDGHGWTYTLVERHIEGTGSTRWFDEILTNEKLGTCRGAGTVTYRDGAWRVGQYSLTLLIPNAIASEVGEMSKAAEAP